MLITSWKIVKKIKIAFLAINFRDGVVMFADGLAVNIRAAKA